MELLEVILELFLSHLQLQSTGNIRLEHYLAAHPSSVEADPMAKEVPILCLAKQCLRQFTMSSEVSTFIVIETLECLQTGGS